MRTIFAEYNPHRNSIDIYTSAGYMLRIDCWETEKDLKTTPGSDCALNALAIDKPLEYVRLYLDGNMHVGRCGKIHWKSFKIIQTYVSYHIHVSCHLFGVITKNIDFKNQSRRYINT